MTFRNRLLAAIQAARRVLQDPGVLVVGSEVTNLLEPGAAATLVVSQDLDIGVPVHCHAAVKRRLPELLPHFLPSPDEPSVWTPRSSDPLELNFVGIDPNQYPADTCLTLLSLIEARTRMPDPRPRRAAVAALLRRLETGDEGLP
jgi:hypothetical protein